MNGMLTLPKNREFFEAGASKFKLGVAAAEGERYWILGEPEVNLKMEGRQ